MKRRIPGRGNKVRIADLVLALALCLPAILAIFPPAASASSEPNTSGLAASTTRSPLIEAPLSLLNAAGNAIGALVLDLVPASFTQLANSGSEISTLDKWWCAFTRLFGSGCIDDFEIIYAIDPNEADRVPPAQADRPDRDPETNHSDNSGSEISTLDKWWCAFTRLFGSGCIDDFEIIYAIDPNEADRVPPAQADRPDRDPETNHSDNGGSADAMLPPLLPGVEPDAAAPTGAERQTEAPVTHIHNTYPVIREIVHETIDSDGNKNGVSRALFDAQIDGLFDSLANQGASISDGLAEAVSTDLLTVTGNGSLTGSLSANSSISASHFNATDTSATSTFAGSLSIGTTTSHDRLTLDGAAYLASVLTPVDTASRLYNLGGDLYWAGNIVGGATTGTWSSDGTNVWRAGGNVGIGTPTPQSLLDLKASNPAISLGDSRNQTWVLGDRLSAIDFASDDTSSGGYTGKVRARIAVLQEDIYGASQSLSFATTRITDGILREYMRLGPWGDLTLSRSIKQAFGVINSGPTYLTIMGSGGGGTGNVQLSTSNQVSSDGLVLGNLEWHNYAVGTGTANSRSAYVSAGLSGTTGSTIGSYLAFATEADGATGAGTERLRIDRNGNVGIGTATPDQKLHVAGSVGTGGVVAIKSVNDDSTGYSSIYAGREETRSVYLDAFGAAYTDAVSGGQFDSNYGSLAAGSNLSGLNVGATASNGILKFFTGGTASANERIRITSTGNVGIGTTNPESALAVHRSGSNAQINIIGDGGSDSAVLSLRGNGNNNWWNLTAPNTGNLTFSNLNTAGDVLTLTNTGNICIGTTNPGSAKLYVDTGVSDSNIGFRQASGRDQLFAANDAISAYTPLSIGASTLILNGDAGTGNVGIGTTNPGAKLEAVTNVRASLSSDPTWYTQISAEDGGAFLKTAGYSALNLTVGATNVLQLTGASNSLVGNLSLSTSKLSGADGLAYIDLYNPSTGNIRIANTSSNATFGNILFETGASATERVRITNDGSVGIGTTSPGATLDVYANTIHGGVTGHLRLSGSGTKSLDLGYDSTSNFAFIHAVEAGVGYKNLSLNPSGGNVGIGTTVPQGTLDVTNAGPAYLDIVSDNNANGADDDALLRFFVDGVSGTGVRKATLGYNQGLDRFVLGYGNDNDIAIDTNGNVGIGTTSPVTLLTLGRANNGIAGSVSFATNGTHTWSAGYQGDGSNHFYIKNERLGKTGLRVQDGSINPDVYLVEDGGNVGIGTTSPVSLLALQAGSPRVTLAATLGTYPSLRLDRQGQNSWDIGMLSTNPAGVNGFLIQDSQSGEIPFSIADGADGNSLVINSSGNVGIGTTSPAYRLDVLAAGTDIARFQGSSGTGCTLSDGGVIACSSDQRLKTDINELAAGLTELMALKPVSYRWKTQSGDMPASLGFIAQDVEEIFPTLVQEDASGTKSLNQIGLIPVIVSAIQELNDKITAFAERIVSSEIVVDNLAATTTTTIRLDVEDRICLGSTCIDEDELKHLLGLEAEGARQSNDSPSSGDNEMATSTEPTTSQTKETPEVGGEDDELAPRDHTATDDPPEPSYEAVSVGLTTESIDATASGQGL